MRAVLACLALALCASARAQDLSSLVNGLRLGVCSGSGGIAPLKNDRRLEQAAAAIARGSDLAQALKSAGYRATRSAFIEITGEANDRQLLRLLQEQHCARLADPAFTDAGVFREAGRSFVVLSAPFAPRVAESQQAAGRRVLALVNEARRVPRHCGSTAYPAAAPLQWNNLLARSALVHAASMAQHGYFSHQGRDGSTPAQRVARTGYRYRVTGENIAAGPTRPEDAVTGWIRSPGHCANLMNPAYTEMGVAYAVNAASEHGVYWAQNFGTPR